MNLSPARKLKFVFLFLMLSTLACNVGGSTQVAEPTITFEVATDIPIPPTKEVVVQDTILPNEPSEVPPSQTPTPTITHVDIPGNPGDPDSFMSDRSSSSEEHSTISDNFDILLLERPFTPNVMIYLPHIDIIKADINYTAPWIYVTIYLVGPPPDDSTAYYGIEVDINVDGRGDVLVTGINPQKTDWTTNGVRVYTDPNKDVGGLDPMKAEAPIIGANGYEEIVFNQGVGDDPDAAWIRVNPNDPKQIQLAFKFDLISSDSQFLWGVWAGEGVQDPRIFDYHDYFSKEEAGSPIQLSDDYPLKLLASIDNTCRWGFGFKPNATHIGACFIAPVAPTAAPSSGGGGGGSGGSNDPLGSISGGVFSDANGDGRKASSEDGISGEKISLGSGSCNSTGLASQNTAGNGSYSFKNLSAGTYCVTSNVKTSCSFSATTATKYTVNLSGGENRVLSWFGYQLSPC